MKKTRTSKKTDLSLYRSKVALASAFGLSLVFSLGTQLVSAGVNPPFVNPPSGNVNPTFTSLETVGDISAGQNLKVGNSIQPKTGTSLVLDAQNINLLGDLAFNRSLPTNANANVSFNIKEDPSGSNTPMLEIINGVNPNTSVIADVNGTLQVHSPFAPALGYVTLKNGHISAKSGIGKYYEVTGKTITRGAPNTATFDTSKASCVVPAGSTVQFATLVNCSGRWITPYGISSNADIPLSQYTTDTVTGNSCYASIIDNTNKSVSAYEFQAVATCFVPDL